MSTNLERVYKMKRLISTCLVMVAGVQFSAFADKLELKVLDGEYWWAGLSSKGHETPYDASSKVSYDLYGDNQGNQAQPLLLSSKGRYVWSEQPIKYEFNAGQITVTTREGKIDSGTQGETLRDAYGHVVKSYFPSDGKIPDPLLFTHPQYNTWIELMYDQNEEDILAYAQAIIDKGYPPGVLMIDDNWQEDYGTWEFSPRRFQDPKGMMDKLHAMGFKVMLWVCPFVSADSADFRQLAQDGLLLLDPQKTQNILWANTKNKAAVIRWWNGPVPVSISAILKRRPGSKRSWIIWWRNMAWTVSNSMRVMPDSMPRVLCPGKGMSRRTTTRSSLQSSG